MNKKNASIYLTLTMFGWTVFAQDSSDKNGLPLEVKHEQELANPIHDLVGQNTQSPKITYPYLKGFGICHSVLLTSPNVPPLGKSNLKELEGLQSIDVEIPGGKEPLEALLTPYFNQKISKETIQEMKAIVDGYFKENDRPFTLVRIPEQNISLGVIQYEVIESRLSEIKVSGNRWVKEKAVQKYFKDQVGDRLNVGQLRKELYRANRNPFRAIDLIYSPGKEAYTTDVEIAAKSRMPVQFYCGVDNTGISITQQTRLFAGLKGTCLWGWDDLLAYQYTSSRNFKNFQAHTLQYVNYLSGGDTIEVYGGYSYAKGDVASASKNHGNSYQGSFRYQIELGVGPHLDHQVAVGFDFKRFNSSIFFSEQPPTIGANINLTQLMFSYLGDYIWDKGTLSWAFDLYTSPFRMLPDESNQAYSTIRPHARNQWLYLWGQTELLVWIPYSFVVHSKVRFQISSTNLLPSEQIGMGGYDTVRGYEERQINKDIGLIGNIELRTPSFSILRHASSIPKHVAKKIDDRMQFLVFFDGAVGKDYRLISGQPASEYLLGAGPGARYTVGDRFVARLDMGFKLHQKDSYGGSSPMFHLLTTASF